MSIHKSKEELLEIYRLIESHFKKMEDKHPTANLYPELLHKKRVAIKRIFKSCVNSKFSIPMLGKMISYAYTTAESRTDILESHKSRIVSKIRESLVPSNLPEKVIKEICSATWAKIAKMVLTRCSSENPTDHKSFIDDALSSMEINVMDERILFKINNN